ncbi:MAG: biotin transporter BioY [Actinomycetota bacterium]
MELVPKITIEVSKKIIFSICFAFLMVIAANCFFYLPFTPVPITLQVLTVLLGAVMLGFPWAFYSQLTYMGLGFMGLGVFAGFKNAYLALSGPTAGYILGFLAASLVTGYLFQRKKTETGLFLSMAAGLLCIYLLGYLHLLFYTSQAAFTVFKLGVAPFIIPDAVKLLLAANIYKAAKGI